MGQPKNTHLLFFLTAGIFLLFSASSFSFSETSADHKAETVGHPTTESDYCLDSNPSLFSKPPLMKERYREIIPMPAEISKHSGPEVVTPHAGDEIDDYDQYLINVQKMEVERELKNVGNNQSLRKHALMTPRRFSIGQRVDTDSFLYYAEKALRCTIKSEGEISPPYVDAFKNSVHSGVFSSLNALNKTARKSGHACDETTKALFAITDKAMLNAIADQIAARREKTKLDSADAPPTESLFALAQRLRKKQNEISQAFADHRRSPQLDEDESAFLKLLYQDDQTTCSGLDALLGAGTAAYLRDFITNNSPIGEPKKDPTIIEKEADITTPGNPGFLFNHMPFKDDKRLSDFAKRMFNLLQTIAIPSGLSPKSSAELASYILRPNDLKDLSANQLGQLQKWFQAEIGKLEALPFIVKPWESSSKTDVKWWRKPLLKEILERSHAVLDDELKWQDSIAPKLAEAKNDQYKPESEKKLDAVEKEIRDHYESAHISNRPYYVEQGEQRQEREISSAPEFAADKDRLSHLTKNLSQGLGSHLDTGERVGFAVSDPLHQSVLDNMVSDFAHKKEARHVDGEMEADQKVIEDLVKNLSGVSLIEALADNPRLRKAFAHTMASNLESSLPHNNSTVEKEVNEFFAGEISSDPMLLAALTIEALQKFKGESSSRIYSAFSGKGSTPILKLLSGEDSIKEKLTKLAETLAQDKLLREKLARALISDPKANSGNFGLESFLDLLTQKPNEKSAPLIQALQQHVGGKGNDAFRTWFSDMALQVYPEKERNALLEKLKPLASSLKNFQEGTPEYLAKKKELDPLIKSIVEQMDRGARSRSSLAWAVALLDRTGHSPESLRALYAKDDPFADPSRVTKEIESERNAVVEAAQKRIAPLAEQIFEKISQGRPNSELDKLYASALEQAKKAAPQVVLQELAVNQDPFYFNFMRERAASPLSQPLPPGKKITPEEKKARDEFAAQTAELADLIRNAGVTGLPSKSRIELLKANQSPEEFLLRSHLAEKSYNQLLQGISDPKRKKEAEQDFRSDAANFSELLLNPSKVENRSGRTDPNYFDYVIDHQQRDRLREELLADLATSKNGDFSPAGKAQLSLLALGELMRKEGALGKLVTPKHVEMRKDDAAFQEEMATLETDLRLKLADRLLSQGNAAGANQVMLNFPGVRAPSKPGTAPDPAQQKKDLQKAAQVLSEDIGIRRRVYDPTNLQQFLKENPLPPSHLQRSSVENDLDEEQLRDLKKYQGDLLKYKNEQILAVKWLKHLETQIASGAGKSVQDYQEQLDEVAKGTRSIEDLKSLQMATNGPLAKAVEDYKRALDQKNSLDEKIVWLEAHTTANNAGIASNAFSNATQKFTFDNDPLWEQRAQDYTKRIFKTDLDNIKEPAAKDLMFKQLSKRVLRLLYTYQQSKERPEELARAAINRASANNKEPDWNSPTLAALKRDLQYGLSDGMTPFFSEASADAAIKQAGSKLREKNQNELEQLRKDEEDLAKVGIKLKGDVLITVDAAYDQISKNQNWSGGMKHLEEVFKRFGAAGVTYDLRPNENPWYGFQNYVLQRFNKEMQNQSFELSEKSGVTVTVDPKTHQPHYEFWNTAEGRKKASQTANNYLTAKGNALQANRDYRREDLNPLASPFVGAAEALAADAKMYAGYGHQESAENKERQELYGIVMDQIAQLRAMGRTKVLDPESKEEVAANDLAAKYLRWVRTQYLPDDKKTIALREAYDQTGAQTLADVALLLAGVGVLPAVASTRNAFLAQKILSTVKNPAVLKMAGGMAALSTAPMVFKFKADNSYVYPRQNAEWVAKYRKNGKPLTEESIPYFLDQNYNGVPDTEEDGKGKGKLPFLYPRGDQWYPLVAGQARNAMLFPLMGILEGAPQAASLAASLRHILYLESLQGGMNKVGIQGQGSPRRGEGSFTLHGYDGTGFRGAEALRQFRPWTKESRVKS